ncbi:hypothetical protein [Pelagovum pacificum]|uniref:Translocase n=1 Tax=Pelagovum pacificum TaxID=2588711 RepID=A0A5C5GGV1_9RHOB|nr:hypothetical protein [Pelagovum pacificum]QQA42893.1 hypothetical protein I8N54_19330 [Pelagovum pacificum]TNY33962.1 hypothetical protein FHY64_12055 [Pelagovum pacificum]
MSQIRKVMVAAGTFGVALSIGFVMQNGDAMAARFGSDEPTMDSDSAFSDGVSPVSANANDVMIVPRMETAPVPVVATDTTVPTQNIAPDAPSEPGELNMAQAMETESDPNEAVADLIQPSEGGQPFESQPPVATMDAAPSMPVAPTVDGVPTPMPDMADAEDSTDMTEDRPVEDMTEDGPVEEDVAAAEGEEAAEEETGGVPIAPQPVFHRAPPSSSETESDSEPASSGTVAIQMPEQSEEDNIVPAAAPMTCDSTLDASVGTAALVTLSLNAPCHPNEQLTMHHQGMLFSVITDGAGQAEVVVPALSDNAVFIAAFDEGTGAVATAQVPALVNYDRAVLQWQGDTGLQIHALEFGAGYDDPGHVWQAAARNAESGIAGEGGFLVRLGDPRGNEPLMAEVYSFPTATVRREGVVELTVEAEITPDNCGREIAAQSIQIGPDHDPDALDLTMSMPECDAVGDFLVLKNMLTDLTLASR